MASKLRARILAAKDIKSQTETVPEWGDESGPLVLELRGLTGETQTACLAASAVKAKGPDGEETTQTDNAKLAQLILMKSLYDPETRALVFEDADADALWQKSGAVLNRLAQIAMRLNGMTADEEAAIEKN